MKNNSKPILIFLIFSMLMSCSRHSEHVTSQKLERNSFHSLKITLDSTFNYRLLDSITLSSDNFYQKIDRYDEKSWSYDSINESYTYYRDSLIPDDYSFKFQTKFSRAQIFKFNLLSDSVFNLKNELKFNKINFIDQGEFLAADTIELLYLSNGCFHSFSERSILVKDNSNSRYFVTVNSNAVQEPVYEEKYVSVKIIDKLLGIQIESNNLRERMLKGNTRYMSTTVQYFFILVKDKLYEFNDRGLPEWKLYEDFQKKMNR